MRGQEQDMHTSPQHSLGDQNTDRSSEQAKVFHEGCIFKVLDLMSCLDDTHGALLCTAPGQCH